MIPIIAAFIVGFIVGIACAVIVACLLMADNQNL